MEITEQVEVPYRNQRNNQYDPFGACNVTCLAMALLAKGIEGDGSEPQFEDQLYQKSLEYGWNRFSPQGLKELCESFEVGDDLTTEGSLQDVREAIDNDQVVIVHGFFTEPGHLIVINGHGPYGFQVLDPNGELMASTGVRSWYYKVNTGEQMFGKDLHSKQQFDCCLLWCMEFFTSADYVL